MKWFSRHHSVPYDIDLEIARRERKKVEYAIEQESRRWNDVRRVVRASREIRRINHMADTLRQIFRE